jgi:peptidyl-dipeptidase Dcp
MPMLRRSFLANASFAVILGSTGLGSGLAARTAAAQARGAMTDPANNPLLQPWTGPYGGEPPFGKVTIEMFPPAFQASIDANRAEIARIADDPSPPTFENTIATQEDAGRAYGRVQSLWGVYTSTLNSKDVQAIDQEWQPKFAAFADEIIQNPKLFARIEAVYNSPDKTRLTPEQQRLVWFYYNDFSRHGAKLSPDGKKQLSAYNQRLAELFTKFAQNELADEEDHALVLESQDDLKGLSDSLVAGYAAAAAGKGQAGKWLVANTRSAMEPFLTFSDRRDLREKGFRMWTSRGDNGDEHDNNAICSEILMLRAKRAKLLGYPTHAHWHLEDSMAKTPDSAMKLMMQVWPAATARVRQEVADMQKVADDAGDKITIAPWDYRYYAEKVRKAKYDLDEAAIKPYLQMDKLREGVHWASGQLYGFDWTEVHDVPTARPEIRVFKVTRDGQLVGLWYFDPYARDGKSSGAWMNEYRAQERFKAPVTPIVSNNTNFVPGKPGEPLLISWDDGITMFHEFGHAIHGLNSNVTYPALAGTNVERDFVEFPSQLNENWLSTPEILGKFALHHQTGAPMPQELVAKIKKAETFNQGFSTVEYLASAIVDMKLHLAGETPIDTRAFETSCLAEIGMPKEIVMRHRIPQFGHIFSGDGYAAGYYSYLWSEVLDHDAYQAFMEEGGPYNPKTAKRYHDTIVSVGNTVDPADAWRAFRGRDPDPMAYFAFKGFPPPVAA